MKYVLLLATICTITEIHAQSGSGNSLEIVPYVKLNKYRSIDDAYGRTYSTNLKLQGFNYGLNVKYIIDLFSHWNTAIGLGYYRYGFNNFKNIDNRPNGERSSSRPIKFPITQQLLVHTDNYWYNTLNINVTVEKDVLIARRSYLTIGGSIAGYYAFSQGYHPTAKSLSTYHTKNSLIFGSFALLNVGYLKSFNGILVGPKLSISMFDQYRHDQAFFGT